MSENDSDFLSKITAEPATDDDSGSEGDAPEVEAVEQADEQAEAKGEPAAPAQVAPEATPAPEKQESGAVPLAALRAEREKRQRLERELEALRTQQQAAPQQKPVDFFEDPMGVLQATVSQVEQQSKARLYAALEADAREAFADYDEVIDMVQQKVAENPALRDQIFASPNPAKAAYKLGKQLREMEQMQDPAAYRARIEAEVRAQIAAEQAAKQAEKASKASAIPPDLAAGRSSTASTEPVDTNPFATLFQR